MKRFYFLLAVFMPVFIFTPVGLQAAVITAGAGSYTDTLPASKKGPQTNIYVSTSIAAPLPTSDWWTSLMSSSFSYRMYAYPLCYKAITQGLLIGYPETITQSDSVLYGSDAVPPYRQQLLVQGTFNALASTVTAQAVKADSYGDFSLTAKWSDSSDPTKYFTTTFGHGLLFTYCRYAAGVSPRIVFPLEWSLGQLDIYVSTGIIVLWDTPTTGDCFTIRYLDYATNKEVYYAVALPPATTFTLKDKGHTIDISFSGTDRYLSVGLMTAKEDLSVWKGYGYAFVSGTKVSYDVDASANVVRTSFTFIVDPQRAGYTTPLVALFPHQWEHSTVSSSIAELATLRGTMKVAALQSFEVENDISGIMPYLPISNNSDTDYLKRLLNDDKDYLWKYTTAYYHGKELAKVANLIPIADQLGETAARDALITKVKDNLEDWFTYTAGESNKFFYYDSKWGALLGYDLEPSFYLHTLNDQHFVFGYYVYASAILSLYDDTFKNGYKDMVELLIRSYASPYRNDSLFPYLRTFDPYEGHSWANGMGGSDDGNDQESSSEAMHSWAAIYLWGVVTDNTTFKKLGMWGYSVEGASVQRYYFNTDSSLYASGYGHTTIGRLFGGKVDYNTWFGQDPEYVHGIQMIPQDATMLYLGRDPDFVKQNYAHMKAKNSGVENTWQDLFMKYEAFYAPSSALSRFSESYTYDGADSKTETYAWLEYFTLFGSVSSTHYADSDLWAVFERNGIRSYLCYNPASLAKTVNFYDAASGSLEASIDVPSKSVGMESRLASVFTNRPASGSVLVSPNPYRSAAGYLLFSGIAQGSTLSIYNIAGEKVFSTVENDGDDIFYWNACNTSGAKIASGVYLFCVTSSASSQPAATGKFAIIK